jgi:alkylated DNA repair dioxygenase AlkB
MAHMNASAQAELEFGAGAAGLRSEDLGGGCLVALDYGFARAEHALWLAALERELPWVQELYARGGRCVPAPRLTSFHGDPGCDYVYSGIRYAPVAWTPLLTQVRARLCDVVGQDFNSVLVNYYRDGRDSVGWHADDEPELGPTRDNIVIASVSLGAARRFVLKHRHTGERRGYELGAGALLVMSGRTQHDFVHALPKTQRPCGPRINLTFRVIGLPRP